MNFHQSFLMAIKSVLNNKMRSFLTMLGIIIGVSSVITLVSVIQGMQKSVMNQFEKMGKNKIVINCNESVDLTSDLYTFCASHSEYIDGVSPDQSMQYKVRYKTKTLDTNVFFGNDKYAVCNNFTLSNGRKLSYTDIKNRVKVAIIGERIRKEMFGFENPVGKKLAIKGQTFTVIGVFEGKFDGVQYSQDDMVLVPYTLIGSITGFKNINIYTVKAKSSKATKTAIDKLTEFLKPKFRRPENFGIYSDNQWMEENNKSMKMFSLVVGGIAGISLLVGGIGIMNIMLVSVSERTREIGIRMAIGAGRRDIISQFLIESGTISACGGVVGIAFGFLGSALLGAVTLKTLVIPSMTIVTGAFWFSVALGMFFGFYPANKASKLQPVEALRAQ
ncbi:MAG: ABC transporter permease [Clostridiales bacterium]|nr:ABC transporter permease [Clostridiales bacterium]